MSGLELVLPFVIVTAWVIMITFEVDALGKRVKELEKQAEATK